ncbi:MAG: CinA family protein [Rhodospirillaceae bacterium]|nr:CinA family protein [Rhodospirillaceae bacterium]
MSPIWPQELSVSANRLLEACRARRATLAVAESCTGGLIAAALTSIAGSSAVLERGFVTYSNAAKTEMLGVPAPLIEAHGAVSAEVAEAMAEGALAHSRASLAASVTGIAGPDGGVPGKPVGTVFIAVAKKDAPTLWQEHHFAGDRAAIRAASALAVLALLLERAEETR